MKIYNKNAWILGNPEIGENVWIGAFCVIDSLWAKLKIGKGSNIASGAQILTHSTVKRCISENQLPLESRATEVGEFCFIGANAVILMGSKIGHHSVVAAGAVVKEGSIIPPYSLVAGIPAKIIGSSKKITKNLAALSITISIPVFNEDKTIKNVIKEALKEVKKITKNYEILIIDDGSNDNTLKIVSNLAKKEKNIRVYKHKKNLGFSGAIKSSLFNGKKDLVLLAPGDGQFDFSELKNLVDAIKGYDIVIAYRKSNKESNIRKLQSQVFHMFCRVLLGIDLKEFSTVSLWRKRALNDLSIIYSGERSATALPEILSKAFKKRMKINQIGITWRLRKGGETKGKIRLNLITKTFTDIIKLWAKINLAR